MKDVCWSQLLRWGLNVYHMASSHPLVYTHVREHSHASVYTPLPQTWARTHTPFCASGASPLSCLPALFGKFQYKVLGESRLNFCTLDTWLPEQVLFLGDSLVLHPRVPALDMLAACVWEGTGDPEPQAWILLLDFPLTLQAQESEHGS